jgi:hypothetical protein
VKVAADFLMRPARALDDRCLAAMASKLERKRRAGETSPYRDDIEAPHRSTRVPNLEENKAASGETLRLQLTCF